MRLSPPLVVAGVVGALVVSGCGSTTSATVTAGAPTTAVVGSPSQLLATAVPSSTGTWAVLPMGILSDPANTFWQAFVLPSPGGRWVLRTPPGVADNGGLVVSSGTGPVAIGFRPSNRLAFSPIAVTSDGGRSYSQGLLPLGLAALPGSLASASTLTAIDGTSVLTSKTLGATWQAATGQKALDALTGLRACAAGAPGAVASTASSTFVAVSCATTGHVAVVRLASGGGAPHPGVIGPSLVGAVAGDHVSVVRMAAYKRGVALLLAARSRAATSYLAAWDPSGGTSWTLSPTWTSPGALASSSLTSAGGFAVWTRPSGGSSGAAALIEPTAKTWRQLPAPPAHMEVVAVTGSRVDALAGSGTTFADWMLHAGKWDRRQVADVSIPYGSSG